MPRDHAALVRAGAAWLRRQGFGVVATEITTGATRERPDVIGFRSLCSAVIEAKTSRADFLRDAHKPHRQSGGLGLYRFFLSVPGVIEPRDVPAGWGLLHKVGRSIVPVIAPRGNMWPNSEPAHPLDVAWRPFMHARDVEMELRVLYSIARRSDRAAMNLTGDGGCDEHG